MPHLAMYSGRCLAASSVMRAASCQEVWSFQSQHCAAGFFFHFGKDARARLEESTGIGLEPVVSTPRPIIVAGVKALFFFAAAASAPVTHSSSPTR